MDARAPTRDREKSDRYGTIAPAELPQLIEGLVAAVGRGELDAQLQAVAVGKRGKG